MLNDILYSSYVQGIFMQNVVLVSPSEIFSLLSATLLILVLSMRISGENFENLFFQDLFYYSVHIFGTRLKKLWFFMVIVALVSDMAHGSLVKSCSASTLHYFRLRVVQAKHCHLNYLILLDGYTTNRRLLFNQ